MKNFIILCAALILSGPAIAAEKSALFQDLVDIQKDPIGFQKKTVADCVSQVRSNETNNGNVYSQFNAYIDSVGTYHYFGTKEERFGFEMCMSQHGYDLGPNTTPPNP